MLSDGKTRWGGPGDVSGQRLQVLVFATTCYLLYQGWSCAQEGPPALHERPSDERARHGGAQSLSEMSDEAGAATTSVPQLCESSSVFFPSVCVGIGALLLVPLPPGQMS